MRTTTIRVSAATRDRLNELARRRGTPASDVVADLVEKADDWALLSDAEQAWERIAADPATLAAYRSEAEELESFEPSLPEY